MPQIPSIRSAKHDCRRPGRQKPSLATLVVTAVLTVVFLSAGLGSAGAQEGPPVDLSALKARSIGPAGMSGRIASIDALESDPDVIFVGAATGGVWKSVNGGQTWTPVFDQERVLGIGSVAVFQGTADIVWVGTGEGNPRNSAGVGAGLYKSMDGGETWSLLGLEDSERIHRIVLHPTDPDVAYVGVMGPAWSDGTERGVYRTVDGGKSWDRVLFVNPRTGVSDLVMDPRNPSKLIASMWEFRRWPWFFESGGLGSGLFITHDGGDSWVRKTGADGLPEGILGRSGLAVASNDPDVVYALVEAEKSGLFRSDDGGETWRPVNLEEGVAARPFYYADIFVDPSNELRLYNLHSRLMRSEDGGKTFQNISGDVHSDFHALWIHPSDPRLLYLGTDGGVYISRDRGDNWRLVDNLPVGQFYHVSVDMDVPFNIYGGMQDNGSWRGPSDLWEGGGIRNYHWKEVGFGDGFGTLLDPTNNDLGYSMSQEGGLVRFDLRTGSRKGIRPWGPEDVDLRFNWNAPIAADPHEPGTIYYGSQFVHKSADRGETWQIISGDLTTNDPEKQRQSESGGLTIDDTGAENHTTLLTIAPSPVEPEVIWAGSDDGLVHLTRSGGGEWEEVGHRAGGVPDGTWVPHIEASRHAEGTAYVVFDDHRRGNWEPYVYRVEEYGRRWRRIADEDDLWGFVHTLEEDPVSPNLLFAGTEFGLWYSLNRGEDWFPFQEGIPAVPVRSLVIHPRDHDLVVGTHGRAIYVIDDIRPLRALAQRSDQEPASLVLFDLPPAYLRGVAAVDGYHFAGDAMFRGETRPLGAMITYLVDYGLPEDRARIEILGSDGDVLRTLEGSGEPGLHRVQWDLREESPFEEEGGGGWFQPTGPEVLPGSYEIRIRLGPADATAKLDVRPDPRVDIPLEERIRKRNAVVEGNLVLSDMRAVESGLAELEELLGLVRQEGNPLGSASDLSIAADSVEAEAERIGEALSRVEEASFSLFFMGLTRDAPTESDRINLVRAGRAVDALAARFNAFVSGRVRRLADEAERAGIRGVPDLSTIPRRGG